MATVLPAATRGLAQSPAVGRAQAGAVAGRPDEGLDEPGLEAIAQGEIGGEAALDRVPSTCAARLRQRTSGRIRNRDRPTTRRPWARRVSASQPIQRSRAARCRAEAAMPITPSQPCSDPGRYRSCRPSRGPAPRGCSYSTRPGPKPGRRGRLRAGVLRCPALSADPSAIPVTGAGRRRAIGSRPSPACRHASRETACYPRRQWLTRRTAKPITDLVGRQIGTAPGTYLGAPSGAPLLVWTHRHGQIAVFVDAGYLYAQGSVLLKGRTLGRDSIRLSEKENPRRTGQHRRGRRAGLPLAAHLLV